MFCQALDGPDQLGHGADLHFLHHPAAVYFHRNLTDAQLGGDLLVELAADGKLKHLMLARREGHVALFQGVVLFDAGGVVLCSLSADSIEPMRALDSTGLVRNS